LKLEDALEIEIADHLRKMEIRQKKGSDYANDDCLANFKATAEVMLALKRNGMEIDLTTPHGVAIFHQILKMLRRLNLYQKKTAPENESLDDTFLDASNYLDLEKECYIDYMEEANDSVPCEAKDEDKLASDDPASPSYKKVEKWLKA